jgi:hypothetical protein
MFDEFGEKINKSKTIRKHGFKTIEEAYNAYKELKYQEIYKVAEYYKNVIPSNL